MMTGTDDFTYENAVNKIFSFINHTEEDKRIALPVDRVPEAAELLVNMKNILKNLNGPIATVFIRRQLMNALGIYNAETNDVENTNPQGQIDDAMSPAPILVAAKMPRLSKKEIDNTRLFLSLAHSNEKANNSRYNEFVITLGTPNLPRRHPGVDDLYHPEKDIDAESLDLLERGNTTLKYVMKNSKKVCPRLLFLCCPVSKDDDQLTQKIHTGHSLGDFAKQLKAEKQLPIHFHFAGHGNKEKLGTMMVENRHTPEELAEYFEHIIETSGLKEDLQSKKCPLEFHLDICNAALTDVSPDDEEAYLKTKLLNESMMGKFAQALKKLGYQNFNVHGYRGYYATMLSGVGIMVSDCLDPRQATVNTAGVKALHTINHSNDEFNVILPKNLNFATFPVTMLAPVSQALTQL